MRDDDQLLWITLTPPGAEVFGVPSHRRTHNSDDERTGSCLCGRAHRPDDRLVGVPLDAKRFDYARAAAWNEKASQLWAESVRRLRRWLALPRVRWDEVAYIRVIEWQQRGLVHIHALVRIRRQPRRRITPVGVRNQLSRARVVTDADGRRFSMQWGDELDVVELTGKVEAVRARAGYVAKYATKSASDSLWASEARTKHYGRIASAVQDRQAGRLTERKLKEVCERLGLHGWLVSMSRTWEPPYSPPATPARDLELQTDTGPWRLAGAGYEGDAPVGLGVQLPRHRHTSLREQCDRIGAPMPDAYLSSSDAF